MELAAGEPKEKTLMAPTRPVLTPASWTNQDLALYHGTADNQAASILSGVNVAAGRLFTDFGQAFYTTTLEQQARSWAWRISRRTPGSSPAVIRFDVPRNDLADLECLWFVNGRYDADHFWSLVFHCRRGGNNHRRGKVPDWYDVVIGPVAGSWRQRLVLPDGDQISFHTVKGANLLNMCPKRKLP